MRIARLPLATLLLPALLLTVACEHRQPLNRATAVGTADSLLLREFREWGEALDVQRPGAPDLDGRRWWQVTYAQGPRGEARIVLVDDRTGWARFPPPGYLPVVAAGSRPVDPAAVRLPPGDWILLLGAPEPAARREALAAEAVELNRLAQRSGLHPAFAVREGRDGSARLVWGWQGDGGTVRDPAAADWVRLRTRHADPAWAALDR